MDIKVLEQLLGEVKDGHLSVAQAVDRLRTLPFEDLGLRPGWTTTASCARDFRRWSLPRASLWRKSGAFCRPSRPGPTTSW